MNTSTPRFTTEAQALELLGVNPMVTVRAIREKLASACAQDPSRFGALARTVRSDFIESAVWRELCDWHRLHLSTSLGEAAARRQAMTLFGKHLSRLGHGEALRALVALHQAS